MAGSKSLSETMKVYLFSTEGQDETQQSKDEADCYNGSVDRSGTDPFELSRQASSTSVPDRIAVSPHQRVGLRVRRPSEDPAAVSEVRTDECWWEVS